MSPGTVKQKKRKLRSDGAAGGAVTPARKEPGSHEGPALVDRKLKLRPKETLHILIQLRAMLSAGVPLLAALRTLREHSNSPQGAKALEKVATTVESGHDLSYAVDCLPCCFPKYAVHLLAAGERAGALDECLGRCSELLDKQIRLNGKIKGALAYPGFLLFMTLVMT
ncbi:MAG: type II secretion system F family protein, partial [Planctomycetes bacterium]|nr:type II secretion system F family protein [Planctomycetota bacterium]